MTDETPFRSVRRAERPKGVARSAVRRGGPCGPPLLMRSLLQLRLCGFLRNPLHGFQSEPFRRPARRRARPTTARLRIRSATPAKGKSPEGLFPRAAMRAAFAPSGFAAFFAAFAADQTNRILNGIRGRLDQPHSPQLMRRYGAFRDPHGCANATNAVIRAGAQNGRKATWSSRPFWRTSWSSRSCR